MSHWWQEKPIRMIQTNLSERDGALDPAELAESLARYHADVVMFNTGGVVANYPSKVQYHYPNPYRKTDLVGEVIERLREKNIRFLARFDFSKLNREIGDEHPDWLYKSVSGDTVCYNGQYHVCLNSDYQQKTAFEVLQEVLDRYPIDGVFFNSIGYLTVDYDYTYHGICQCNNCKRLFRKFSGMELPTKEDPSDPVFRKYQQFKEQTIDDWFRRVHEIVKGKSEEIAICASHHKYCDILRKESGSNLHYKGFDWDYMPGFANRSTACSWDDIKVTNCAVQFIDFPFRQSAVPAPLTELRLAQNLANAGWMDFYVCGTLTNQYDRTNLEAIRALYQFHFENEEHYTDVTSHADVALVQGARSFGGMNEMRGIYSMLTQSHIPFDVLDGVLLEDSARLGNYRVVILPGISFLGPAVLESLERYIAAGGHVVATGLTGIGKDGTAEFAGWSPAGITALRRIYPEKKGTFLHVKEGDHARLAGMAQLDLVCLTGEFAAYQLEQSCEGLLNYIDSTMFGPPEKCYFTDETDWQGVIHHRYGKWSFTCLPWKIGEDYHVIGNHAQRMIFESVLTEVVGLVPSIQTDAPAQVELTAMKKKNGSESLLSFVNYSGRIGTTYYPPLEVREFSVCAAAEKKPMRVYALWGKQELDFCYDEEKKTVRFVLPALGLYEGVVICYA